jgi:hypothetical protein
VCEGNKRPLPYELGTVAVLFGCTVINSHMIVDASFMLFRPSAKVNSRSKVSRMRNEFLLSSPFTSAQRFDDGSTALLQVWTGHLISFGVPAKSPASD